MPVETLVREHEALVRRLVFRLSGWRGNDCEDLVQDVFVKAMENGTTFEGRAAVSTWLTAIAVNVCRAERRKRAVRRALFGRWATEAVTTEAARPSKSIEEEERGRQVVAAVQDLPGKYREVIVLRYLEELDLASVAAAVGISKGAAEVRLHRGRALLAEKLTHLHGGAA